MCDYAFTFLDVILLLMIIDLREIVVILMQDIGIQSVT